jgi:dUTP pyrophosphatase
MKVQVQKLCPDAKLPTYATDGSGAFDLYAHSINGYSDRLGERLQPHKAITIGTGLAFALPDDHVMLIFSRSGHGFRSGVRLTNCVGVIDADYRGEVMVQLTADMRHLDQDQDSGGGAMWIHKCARIAQAIVIPRPRVTFDLVDQLTTTQRGAAGLGSTGA